MFISDWISRFIIWLFYTKNGKRIIPKPRKSKGENDVPLFACMVGALVLMFGFFIFLVNPIFLIIILIGLATTPLWDKLIS